MLLIALRIFLYALLLSISALIVFADAYQLQSAEESFTEMAQEFILLLMVVIGIYEGRSAKHYKTFIFFLASISSVFLVREFNNYLTDEVFDGAWQTIALILILVATYYFFKKRKQLKDQILALKESGPFALIMMGGLQLIVFSRIYGNKNIWKNFMGEDYLRMIKEVSEESIELMAYAVIFIGFMELIFLSRKIDRKQKSEPTH
mgnify:CR=1 FL=1